MVRHCDLECIKSEVMKMKESLPAVLASSLSVLPQLTQTEKGILKSKTFQFTCTKTINVHVIPLLII